MQSFSLRHMILDHQMSIMQREKKLTLNNGMLFQTVAGLFQIVVLGTIQVLRHQRGGCVGGVRKWQLLMIYCKSS